MNALTVAPSSLGHEDNMRRTCWDGNCSKLRVEAEEGTEGRGITYCYEGKEEYLRKSAGSKCSLI